MRRSLPPILQIITQCLIAFAALGALCVSVYNSTQINDVHVTVNSRMSELLEITKKASRAEGVKQESDRRDLIPD